MHARTLALAAVLLSLSPTALADVEYDVVRLPAIPDALAIFGADVNEAGEVVGYAQFSTSPLLRAWRWSDADGLEILPPPPGLTTYRAVAINDAGTILGDGGIDFGEAWRFENGAYEMLGTLAGDTVSIAASINASGAVCGVSKTLQISDPPDTFFAPAGASPTLLQSSTTPSRLNDANQVVGWTSNLVGFRAEPGQPTFFLPPLGQHVLVTPASINSAGTIVGSARHANGNASVPFLYTDAGGMQEIGSFGGGAAAVDVSDTGVIVGNFSVGGDFPWIVEPGGTLRFLDDLIDPAEQLALLVVARTNEAGVLLVRAADLTTFKRYPVLLVPVTSEPGTASCFGVSCPCGNDDPSAGCANSTGAGARLAGSGSASVALDDLVLTATGCPPLNSGLVFAGDTAFAPALVVGDGFGCAGGLAFRYFPGQVDGSGVFTQASLIGSAPAGFITPGVTRHFQVWTRDVLCGPPPSPCASPCGTNSNLSNAYTVTFAP